MSIFVSQFLSEDEDGAVTVDWVVLTAGIIGLSLAGIGFFVNGAANVGGTVSNELSKVGDKVAAGTL